MGDPLGIGLALGKGPDWLAADLAPGLETLGMLLQCATFLKRGEAGGASMVAYLVDLLVSTLMFGVLYMTSRASWITIANHCVLVVLVGTKAALDGRLGDSAAKIIVEYAFFVYILCSGALQADWYLVGLPSYVPAVRCFSAVAQMLHCKNARSTGALSFSACALLAGAAWARVLGVDVRTLTGAKERPLDGTELTALMLGDWRTLRAAALSALLFFILRFGAVASQPENSGEGATKRSTARPPSSQTMGEKATKVD